MKKIKLLYLFPIAGLLLSSCSMDDLMFWKKKDNEESQQKEDDKKQDQGEEDPYRLHPEITGGDEAEQTAILEVLNNKPICARAIGQTGTIFDDTPTELKEDLGAAIKLTLTQLYKGKTVNIEWAVDESQEYFLARQTSDEAHDLISIDYKGKGVADGQFKWKISKMTCGSAVALPNVEFTAKIVNSVYHRDDALIRNINKVTDEEKTVVAGTATHKFASTFDIIDYEFDPDSKYAYSPYFRTNNPDAEEGRFLYYNVNAKVIYTAPDGNWGLIGDGDQVLEIYAGAGTPLTTKNFPNLANGSVQVIGNMSQYCGNIQLGFIYRIKAIDGAGIADPVLTYPALTESDIAGFKVAGYGAQKQAIDGFSNSLRSVTGTLIPGSIKNKDGEVTDADGISCSGRFTFELQVGEEKMKVAYDYHADKDGSQGVFSALKAKLAAGGEMTIKGTMRYEGDNDLKFITEDNEKAVWTVVPFLPAHIA